MRILFASVILFCTYLQSALGSNVAEFMPQLSYARHCAASLEDTPNAINIYTELVHLLEESDNDSLHLVACSERVQLLHRTGKRLEVMKSLPNCINLAYRLQDHAQLASLLGIKAYIYIDIGFQNKGKDILVNATNYALKIKDESIKNTTLGYLEIIKLLLTESTEKQIFLYNKAYSYFSKVPSNSPLYPNAQVSGNFCYAVAFMQRNLNDSAQKYLEKSISYIKKGYTSSSYYATINTYARILYAQQQYKEAEKWLYSALETAELTGNLYQTKNIIDSFYELGIEESQDPILEEKFTMFRMINDALRRERRVSIKLIESELKQRSDQLVQEASEKQTPIIVLLSGATFLLCITVGRLYIKQRREVRPVIVKENTFPEESTNIVTAQEIQELTALALSKQNDAAFLLRFQEVYPNFAARINAMASTPLNQAELEICACTKLKLSTKDIALYRNYTIRSVENRKYRIRKKLALDSDTDFIVWIASVN